MLRLTLSVGVSVWEAPKDFFRFLLENPNGCFQQLVHILLGILRFIGIDLLLYPPLFIRVDVSSRDMHEIEQVLYLASQIEHIFGSFHVD